MNDNNLTVAKEFVKQLKAKKLVADEEISLEIKVADGTIKENDWKLIFEQHISNMEKQANFETE